MKGVFSRQTIVGKERRGGIEGRERRWRLHLWHHRESISHEVYLWAFITLVNARQTVWNLQNPSDVKALTHADYGGGRPPLSQITGFQAEHSLHMWACLVVWELHMLLIKENICFWQVSGAMSAVKRNESPNWDRSQKAHDRSTDKHKAEERETRGRQTWAQVFCTVC